MSLGIQIGSEFLDLLPGTILELERDNPFLQFGEELKGTHSWPFELPDTDRNRRLTRYASRLATRVDVKGQDCTIYDTNPHSIGKLKIEGVQHHLNRTGDARLSCYVLSEWSYFFQEIKGINLREVSFGGNRMFTWDGFTRVGDSFWGHLHQVIDAPAGYGSSGFDYAFFPVINKGLDTGWGELMNRMELFSGQVWFKQQGTAGRPNYVVPFPYLSYVLRQVLSHIGWTITGDILEDPEFKKITLLNFQNVPWGFRLVGGAIAGLPIIGLNLQQHVPDISLVQFFLWLKNRFGWWYDIDRKTRTINIKPLKVTTLATIKDMTPYASPVLPKKINQEKKGYALRNQFMGAYNDGPVDFSGAQYQGLVNTPADLSATYPPNESRYGHVYLVVSENTYYICLPNDDTGTFQWEIFAPNIGDVEPEGENEDITTAAVAIPSEKYDAYHDSQPRIDAQDAPQALYMVTYHGQRANKAGQPVPFATSGIYDSTGAQVGTWSLCYSCKKYDGTDVGLYELAWKPFLATLQTTEEGTVTLRLPRVQYDQLQFFDVISITNTHLYIKKIKTRIPYDGSVDIEVLRI